MCDTKRIKTKDLKYTFSTINKIDKCRNTRKLTIWKSVWEMKFIEEWKLSRKKEARLHRKTDSFSWNCSSYITIYTGEDLKRRARMERKLFTKKLKYCGESSRVQEEERIVQGRSVHVCTTDRLLYPLLFPRPVAPPQNYSLDRYFYQSSRAWWTFDCFHKNSTTPKDAKIERNPIYRSN